MWILPFFSASEAGGGVMRAPAVVLFCAIGLSHIGFSQQTPTAPKKVLTPEQQAFREEMRVVGEKRDSLRAKAHQAFDAEMAQQKAGDCPNAENTYEFGICFGKAAGVADQNLKAYEEAIRDLLGLKYPNLTGNSPTTGPAGPVLTPEESVAEFDRVEQLWHSYLDAAATAAFHQFGGGTGGPSFEMETHLRLVRSHMLELNEIYDMLLRL
ncbi:MAG TPA: hypothetical protein VH325_01290 [Bryobacteraceae bacterium]|nr:hypothetical protein [Bryobacteraceae bacterium]